MNSPFNPRNRGDFRPRPLSEQPDPERDDKIRAAIHRAGDFRPKVAVPPAPKGSVTPRAEEAVETGHPAQQPAKKEGSKETGATTPPAEESKTQKSSSPAVPRTPSKRSDSA